ncbi:2347_t:CDS:10 [Funneliformis geosporum]|nr:2347_t:CDS:10 [Funneliformis geosporum]
MLQIETRHQAMLKGILTKYPYHFYAYGSRVKGTARKFSDLDICYQEEIPPRTITELSKLKEHATYFSENDKKRFILDFLGNILNQPFFSPILTSPHLQPCIGNLIFKNMTENDTKLKEKAKKIYHATESIVLKAGEKALDGAKEFLNHPLDTTEKIYEGLKSASKKALNFGVDTATNLLTDPQKALHTGLGLMERGLNALPVVGGFFSFITGTAKDALTDKKFEEMANQIQGVKEGLNSLADAVGDALDGLRGEMAEALEAMGARQDQLEQFTKAFQAEQNKVNQQVQKKIENLEETLKEHEKKIKDNSEKIFKEQIKLEDVRSEIKDQIRVTNTNIENLRQEQEEVKYDFEKYKHQINEKSAKTEQVFDDLQADYTKRNKIIETQIHDNEEQLSEFQENLSNVNFQQKKLNLDYQELAEDLEEQVNLAREQKTRLDFVVNEIDDIQEEFNQKINRITQSQLAQEEKVDEAVFAAKRATRKVDEIAEKLEKHSKKVDNLEKQIEKNKQDTQKAKEEAKRANERIDSLLKNQQLLDHSKETQVLDKIKKSLELKAEEAQLLASLELLKKTQKLLNDNEQAPLTDPEKRKPEETAPSQSPQQTEETQEQQKNLQEVIEETKSQLLEQLQELQEQINENVSSLEEKTTASQEDSESEEEEEIIEELEKKETQLRTERQSLGNPSLTPQQKKKLQENKIEKEDKLTQLQQQLEKIEVEEKKQEKATEQAEEAVEKKNKEIEKIQQQKPHSITSRKIDKDIKDAEQKANQAQHEYEEQILEDSPETPTLKKIEEKIQEIKESQSSEAAPQKSMSLYMLYLIIFLLEYIVYKRNGKEVETKQQELTQAQEEFAEETIQKETEYIDRLQESQEILEKVKEKTKNLSTVNFSTLSQGVGESEEHLTSPEAQKLLKLVQESGTVLNSEEQELIQKIQTKQKEQDYQEFTQLTNKITPIQEDLKKILTKLLNNLSAEQITAISSQSPYLRDNQDQLINIYSYLSKEEKLKLLNSGLDGLQINTKEQKQELLNIRLITQQEEKHFDLSITEKENIFRLITSRVSESQLKTYEEYGVPLYNASSWQITPEHKKSLLELAEDLIKVNDKEKLFNLGRENLEKFPLSGKQEQILKTLAPLQKGYNYSENLLKKLNSLPKLKKKVLAKQYKEEKQKEAVAQQTQKIRNSLLPSLLYFAQLNPTDLAYQEYRFKQVPRYYFFDLLIFACETFIPLETKEETNEEELKTQKAIKQLSNDKLPPEQQYNRMTLLLNSYPNDNERLNFLVAIWEEITYLEEKFERLASAYDRMRDYLDSAGMPERTSTEQTQSSTSSTSTPYDDLLSGLDQEERERLRKKKARDEAKKKLDEMNFANRQANLSEKDRKLKEEEEKRLKDKELAEQEAEKARLAQEARNKALTEDREDYLTDEKKLMEETLAKELEEINITDKQGRQKIEEKFKKRQNEIKKEMNEVKRKNDDELKEKEAALIKENEANQAELDKIRKEIELQEQHGRETKEKARLIETELKGQKDRENQLKKYRAELYDAVLDYVFTSDEGREGTRNPTKGYGCLRELLDESPSMEFNLHFGDIADVNRTHSRYRKAIEIFRKVIGNRFVTKQILKESINAKVQSLDYISG